VAQAQAPERPIAGGLATPAPLAQVLVSKYRDHTPLYRQAADLRPPRNRPSTFEAGRLGRRGCWWLEALHERLARNVFASDHLFADDTPVPVLDPGRGRTKTGRLWVYAREQRAWGGPEFRLRSICMRPTAKPNARPRISSGSRAFFMSTAMPALSRWRREGTSWSPHA